ncbi:Receptor homology region, transmembrane domain-and RING domain-containing protein 6, partial [Linum perenne]
CSSLRKKTAFTGIITFKSKTLKIDSKGHLGFNRSKRASFALIVREACAFENKIRNAELTGFRAAIEFDDRDKRNLVYSKSSNFQI